MFISALVTLFAFGLAVFSSLRFNFYLGPTLLSFAWSFLLYVSSRPRRAVQWIALVLILAMTPAVHGFCARWKQLIDDDRVLMATAYMEKLEDLLLKYHRMTRTFPTGESFPDVIWIISELEIGDVSSFEYRDRHGRRRTVKCPRLCTSDPWGARYIYNGHEDRAILISSGPDLKIKTSDDIVRLVSVR